MNRRGRAAASLDAALLAALALLAASGLVGAAACADPAPAAAPAPTCTGPCDGGAGGSGELCPDLSASGSCLFEGPGDGCPGATVCTVTSRRCPGGGCCTLEFSCVEPVGQTPGGGACEADDDCVSGLCLALRDTRFCARACHELEGNEGCPVGFSCSPVSLDPTRTVRSCIPGTAEAPEPGRTLCASDRDCPADRSCRVFGELGLGGSPVCLPRLEGSDVGRSCAPPAGETDYDPERHWSPANACDEGGLCLPACDDYSAVACDCTPETILAATCPSLRCTAPCLLDSDCPDRTICTSPKSVNARVEERLGFEPRFCVFPSPTGEVRWGCFDQTDCCAGGLQRDGSACCNPDAPECLDPPVPFTDTFCRVTELDGRALTICELPLGLARPGEPCSEDAGCESGLCVAGAAGGKLCSTPCDETFDRCEAILPGSSCCRTPWGDAGAHCIPACRFDCPATPACG